MKIRKDFRDREVWRFCHEWKVRQKDVEAYLKEYHAPTEAEERVIDGCNIFLWRGKCHYPHVQEELVYKALLSDLRRLYGYLTYDDAEEMMGESEIDYEEEKKAEKEAAL